MAVSKIWNVNSRLDKVINYGSNEKKTTNPDYDPLKTVLGYGDNPDKTEKQLYSTGINCDAEFAYQQFVTVKNAIWQNRRNSRLSRIYEF